MTRLVLAAAVAALSAVLFSEAHAQRFTPSFSNIGPRGPSLPPSIGPRVPTLPPSVGPGGPGFDQPPPYRPRRPRVVRRAPVIDPQVLVDDTPRRTSHKNPPPKTPRKKNDGGDGANAAGLPPAGEDRFVPDEVIIQMAGDPEPMARRHRLVRMERLDLGLTGQTLYRWRIPDGRSVRQVIQQLARSGIYAQPNYLFRTSQQEQAAQASPATETQEGDPAQYAVAKLHLTAAHKIAKGDKVLVAVIDSGIDAAHPELAGAVADTFDAIPAGEPHSHGTAIAGAIAAHARLAGVAPSAQILGVRAFDPSGNGAEGTTFNILKGLNWAADKGARIFNMSFAGPTDPTLARAMAGARQRGIVLIAASGNAGAKSPPLFPASDPNVIAVSATDADDRLFDASNRGKYIAVAAPGADILLPAPGGSYQVLSGTSFAAAHVSGIAALILERRPELKPDAVRNVITAAAKDIGPKGRDPQFGAGLVDALQSLTSLDTSATASR